MAAREHSPAAAARQLANHGGAMGHADWRSTLARSGLVAKGTLYSALGLLAIQVAAGGATSDRASSRGAIELVASQPFGQWLLALLTFGLFALTVWHVILAVKGDPVEGSEFKDRATFAGKAFVYFGTAMTAAAMFARHWGNGTTSELLAAGASGGEGSQDRAAATVMSWPAGEWLVGLLGASVIAFGAYQIVHHAWKKRFMRRLDRSRMHPDVDSVVERAGRAGYAARGIVFGIIGIFLVVAAIEHDPREAVGLSGALQAMARENWGELILWIVALGLFLYGCFCFAEARYRRAT